MIVPNYYKQLKTLPEDPPKCEAYIAASECFQCFIKVFPIPNKYLMPLDTKVIIDEIHQYLSDDQGLIECEVLKTNNGKNIVYSIIKTKMEPSGVQYFLRAHIIDSIESIEVNAFADETGITGMRDANVFELFIRKNKDSKNIYDGWFEDPYDKNYKKGLLKNKSELREFDELFPDHPLSELRRLLNYFAENN